MGWLQLMAPQHHYGFVYGNYILLVLPFAGALVVGVFGLRPRLDPGATCIVVAGVTACREFIQFSISDKCQATHPGPT
jgi:hypothetical protein